MDHHDILLGVFNVPKSKTKQNTVHFIGIGWFHVETIVFI